MGFDVPLTPETSAQENRRRAMKPGGEKVQQAEPQ